jgi:CHAT domain-containing protein
MMKCCLFPLRNLLYGMWLLFLLLISYSCTNDTEEIDDQLNQQEVLKEDLLLMLSSHREKIKQSSDTDSLMYWYAAMGNIFARMEEWDSVVSMTRNIYITSKQDNTQSLSYQYLTQLSNAVNVSNDTIWAYIMEVKGLTCFLQGDYERSLHCYKKGTEVLERYPGALRLLGCYNMLAIIYTINGDYPLAESIYQSAIPQCIEKRDTLTLRKFYSNLGKAQLAQGNWEDATANFQQAQELIPYEDGFYESNMAQALIEGNQAREALPLAQESLRKRQIFEDRSSFSLSNAYEVLASAYHEMGNYDLAIQYHQECLEEILSYYSPEHRDMGETRIFLADAYYEKDLLNLALQEYQQAIQIFLPGFNPISIDDCPSADSLFSRDVWLMEALRNKGRVYLKQYEKDQRIDQLTHAAKHFLTAVQFINQVKLYYTESGAKAFLGDYSIPFIEDALNTQLQLYQATQDPQHMATAFELAQQATAFLLRESVNEERAMEVAQIPEDTIATLRTLNATISETQSAIAKVDVEEKDSLNQVVFYLKKDRLELLETIEKNYPKYYQLKHDLRPFSIEEVQQNLDSNTLVIKYFLGQDKLYTFAFDQQKFSILSSPIDSTFYKHVDHFRQTLSDLDYIRAQPQEAEQIFLESSRALYEQLLAPVVTAFPEEKLTQLTIIPDGLLNYLSFECLLSKPADDWLDKEAYLLQDYAVRYAYYAGLLRSGEQEKDRKKSRFLGFGTEYNDKTLDRLNMIAQDSIANPQVKEVFRGKALSRLEFADDEVQEVAQLVDGRSFLNTQATKDNFLLHTPDYEVVHIAAHSYIDTENDSTAYIVFNQSEEDEDFLLSLPEIYGLNLDADLVALSACQTSSGALQRSEGVMSLARAFQFAGSSSLIASQWNISDRASSIIIKAFYENLNEGLSKDEALQKAKLAYLSDDELSSPAYRIPAYWGAMILIGDEQPLAFEPSGYSWHYWLIGLILLLIVVFFVRRKSQP